ncbi:hypothetical protein IC582_024703 [Cucumis melo]
MHGKKIILNILITLQIYSKAFEALSASSKSNEMFVTLRSHSKLTLSSCERRDKKIFYKTVGTEFCSKKSAS